jgi:hypothetical protein
MGYVVRADVMDVQVPERSVAQRMEALQHANEVRLARAEWKREVKRDPSHNTVLLPLYRADLDGWSPFDTMHVGDYLRSIPKVGPVKVTTALRRMEISRAKTLSGLTDRQRAEVHAFVVPYMRRERRVVDGPPDMG